MALKEPVFEAVEVGETFGPIEVAADEHYLRNGSFAVDDYSRWYVEGGEEFDGRIVPPTAIARDLVALFCTKFDANKVVGLHQKEEVWFHSPARVDTTMIYTGRYVDKYMKRGKGYVILESEARNLGGDLLVRQRSTEIMRIPDRVILGEGSAEPSDDRVRGIWPADGTPASQATANIPPDTPIPTLRKTAYQDQMSVFSGAVKQWHNIHTDERVARRAGFRDSVAAGMMETCWVSEMLANFFGASWHSTGWIKMAYLRPVYHGDTLTCRGLVTGSEVVDGSTRLKLEVWLTNATGEMTAAGWACGSVGD